MPAILRKLKRLEDSKKLRVSRAICIYAADLEQLGTFVPLTVRHEGIIVSSRMTHSPDDITLLARSRWFA